MSTWSCRICTYEHCGREADFLACAVCGYEGGNTAVPSSRPVAAATSREAVLSKPPSPARPATSAAIKEVAAAPGRLIPPAVSQEAAFAPAPRPVAPTASREAPARPMAPAACREAPACTVAAAEDTWGNWLVHMGRGTFQVQMGSRGLGDEEAIHWSHVARRRFAAFFSETGVPPHAALVNFSENRLGSAGLQAIIELLSDLKIGVRVFQLHRNELDNRAADVLKQFIVMCPIAIEELHLSHNQLELEGALTLVGAFMSAGARGSPLYPVRDQRGRWRPVWLRLEFNRFAAVKHELLQPAREEIFRDQRRSCGYKTREGARLICCVPDGAGCRSGICSMQQDSFGPVVHLPHMRSREAHGARTRTCAAFYPSSEEVYEEAPRSTPGLRTTRNHSSAQKSDSRPDHSFSTGFVSSFFQEVEHDASSDPGLPGKGNERGYGRENKHNPARLTGARELASLSKELPPSQSQVPIPCFAAPAPEDVPAPALVVRIPGQQPRLYV